MNAPDLRASETLFNYFPGNLRDRLAAAALRGVTEIRMRAGKPLLLYNGRLEIPVTNGERDAPYYVTVGDIQKTLERMSDYSLYALESELGCGFFTLPGGHRVGVTGRAVGEGRSVKTLKYINALNIRISHEIIGCAEKIERYAAKEAPKNTMIISPPGCGKTTLLRDLIRIISSKGYNTAVVDERSEIAGCYMGVPQNDLGIRTDVLDACPKSEGIMMLLRSMSPAVIAVDEIGSKEDASAIEEAVYSGVKLLCSAHASALTDLYEKSYIGALMEKKVFECFIAVSGRGGPGTLEAVYGKEHDAVFEAERGHLL